MNDGIIVLEGLRQLGGHQLVGDLALLALFHVEHEGLFGFFHVFKETDDVLRALEALDFAEEVESRFGEVETLGLELVGNVAVHLFIELLHVVVVTHEAVAEDVIALVSVQKKFELFFYEIEVYGVIQELETLLNCGWLPYKTHLRTHKGLLRFVRFLLLFSLTV